MLRLRKNKEKSRARSKSVGYKALPACMNMRLSRKRTLFSLGGILVGRRFAEWADWKRRQEQRKTQTSQC